MLINRIMHIFIYLAGSDNQFNLAHWLNLIFKNRILYSVFIFRAASIILGRT